jgi:hypothetical protein
MSKVARHLRASMVGQLGAGLASFPIRLYFRRPMIRLNVPVSMKCKTDKPSRHKDGSGHHHPMGVFPVEQQVQHLAIAPSRYFPFLSPSSTSRRMASERVSDPCFSAQASISAVKSVGNRTAETGSRPVAGRPRFFWFTFIDFPIK